MVLKIYSDTLKHRLFPIFKYVKLAASKIVVIFHLHVRAWNRHCYVMNLMFYTYSTSSQIAFQWNNDHEKVSLIIIIYC